MKVIITEKPSVAREFAEVLNLKGEKKEEGYISGYSSFLGCDVNITWAVGHLISLSYPEKYDEDLKKWSLDTLPFLPDEYLYEPIKSVKKQFDIVKKLYHSSDIDELILAGDSAREGIYIQYLIVKEAKVKSSLKQTVVWINSHTADEVKKGLTDRKSVSEYADLISAGKARAIEDYAIGINFSRALSCKFGYAFNKKINAKKYTPIAVGRVMTCVLGMIVRREREINAFKETYYYKVTAKLNDDISANWKAVENTPYYNSPELYGNEGFLKKERAQDFIDSLQNPLTVIKTEKKREKKTAPLLFNLAELQNECSKRFKLSPDGTLEVVQKLYEAKMTTYPRTDARVLSSAVADEILKNLNGLKKINSYGGYVDNILSSGSYKNLKKTKYVDDSKISDHYAIIPTGEGSTGSLNELEKDVYDLIVRRFLSIFYPAAEYDKYEIELTSQDGEHFFVSEKILVSPGYLEIAGNKDEKKDSKLGHIKAGDTFSPEYAINEGKTSPPKRYTSGSMILAMENAGNLIEDEELRAQIKSCGIGTSATRANIISKLADNSYIKLDKKSQVLSPTDTGEILYDIVDGNLPALLSPNMTASWEKGLSQIESGQVSFDVYIKKMNEFIIREVGNIKSKQSEQGEEFKSEEVGKCPLCGGTVSTTRNGYRCENFDKDNGCHFYIGEVCGVKIDREQIQKLMESGETDVIDGFKSKKGNEFSAKLVANRDNNSVDLAFAETEEKVIGKCPFCHSDVVSSVFGYRCRNYNREDGCGFYAGKICGRQLSEDEVKALLSDGKTPLLKGLKSKSGKKFDAYLTVDDEKQSLSLMFPDSRESFDAEETDFECIKCGNKLKQNHNSVFCSCGFKVYTTIAKKKLKKNEIASLLAGRTGVIKGFVSKSGKKFDAALTLDDSGKVSFLFPDKD